MFTYSLARDAERSHGTEYNPETSFFVRATIIIDCSAATCSRMKIIHFRLNAIRPRFEEGAGGK